MKIENIAFAAIGLVCIACSIALAGECGNCYIVGIDSYTVYEGSGQYCVKTTVPAGSGTAFIDLASADAGHYEGEQYVTTDFNSAAGTDSMNIENGIGGTLQTAIDNYHNSETNQTETMATTYKTCIFGNGYLGTVVYVTKLAGYGYQYAYSDEICYVSFGQVYYLDGTFNYGLEAGMGTIGPGSVYMYNEYYPLHSMDAMSFFDMSAGKTIAWLEVETTESLNLSTYAYTDFLTDEMWLGNEGRAYFITTITTDGNLTFGGSADLNGRMHYDFIAYNGAED